ncbi:MAG: VTT domain-containing protein [Pseudomonadota bacterium]
MALWWLAIISFTESIFFPIPPDVMIIPMVLAARKRWFAIATIATTASVAGGLGGYLIGFWFYDTVGQPMLELYGHTDALDEFLIWTSKYGFWFVWLGGLTPIPYKLTTIAAGAFMLPLPQFILASFLARALRFYALSALIWWCGPAIQNWLEHAFAKAVSIFSILVVAGFLLWLWL